MTKKEAIAYFKRRKKALGLSDRVQEAEDIAIQALENGPDCTNCERNKGENAPTAHWDMITCRCSRCGLAVTYTEAASGKYKYCYQCGAKMN